MTDPSKHDQLMARWLRLSVIRNVLGTGNISHDDAVELLKGPLNPDDPSTIVDDSALVDLPLEEVEKVLGKLRLELPND